MDAGLPRGSEGHRVTPLGLVDGLVQDRVLVFGSLPPHGRDLDLLVRAGEEQALSEGLAVAGYCSRGHEWAHFHDCTVDLVELVPATSWSLPKEELRALFDDAELLPSAQHVAQPAPHHALLILARRVARSAGGLATKHRARVDAALEASPTAWEDARENARAWDAEEELSALRALHGNDVSMGSRLASQGRRVARGARARRPGVRRRRNGLLVTFSGLDGSGKSTQCEALAATLNRLGYETSVEWTSLVASLARLYPVARLVRRVLKPILRIRGGPAANAPVAAGEPAAEKTAPVRERNPLVASAWTTLACLANARWHRRAARPLRGRPNRVVVCDRYVLDSHVQLRYEFGRLASLRPQTLVFKLLSPRPARSWLLDVSPEAVYLRNQEYTPEQTARRAAVYRSEHAALGVARLDGERPAEELCALLAEDVWRLLA